jgi:hypothetical protein
MKYTVLIERYTQKQILLPDKKIIPIIKSAIASLNDNPEPYGKKLKVLPTCNFTPKCQKLVMDVI